jgi:hypothetical protein
LKYWNLRNKASFPVAGDFVKIKIDELDDATAELVDFGVSSLDSTGASLITATWCP